MKYFFTLFTTAKPELTATSEQRPPVNNGRYNSVTASINLTFIRAPLSNGHFFKVPRVVVVHRFDCTLQIFEWFGNNFKPLWLKKFARTSMSRAKGIYDPNIHTFQFRILLRGYLGLWENVEGGPLFSFFYCIFMTKFFELNPTPSPHPPCASMDPKLLEKICLA